MDKIIDATAFETYCTEVLKLSAEELASLYNEAGEAKDFSLLKKKDAERVARFATDKTGQYNRGLKEGAGKLEKELKEKYEIESDLVGMELFDSILETKISEVQKAAPEDVLKHPDVIKALNAKDKLLKAKDKEMIDKLKAKEDEINSTNLFKEFESLALTKLDSLNPILPGDAKKAHAQKSWFSQDLKKNKIQKNDKGEFIILKDDGTPLKDDHGYDVSVDDYVKGIGERYFDFKVADDRSSSGNSNNQSGNNQSKKFGPKVRKPKDKEDFIKMSQDNTLTSEERIEINKLWNEVKNSK